MTNGQCEQKGCLLPKGHNGLHQVVARIFDIEEQPETTLEEQVQVVAEVRGWFNAAKEEVDKARAEWEKQNDIILGGLVGSREVVQEQEALLRELTLKAYAETGSKNPAIGVGIREVTKLEYDTAEAMKWAMEHRIVLRLDVPAFEKMAKMAPETRPSFVTVTTEPQATIATNLDEARKS